MTGCVTVTGPKSSCAFKRSRHIFFLGFKGIDSDRARPLHLSLLLLWIRSMRVLETFSCAKVPESSKSRPCRT